MVRLVTVGGPPKSPCLGSQVETVTASGGKVQTGVQSDGATALGEVLEKIVCSATRRYTPLLSRFEVDWRLQSTT